MPDNSIECFIGRLEEKIEGIKEDLQELKIDQKKINDYITTQKVGSRIVISLIVALGSIFVYYKEHLEQFIFGTKVAFK